jgi:hypothetical protein
MNAYELYQAAFDTANDYAEATVEYIQQYADGVFDLYVSSEVAHKMLTCRSACEIANGANGDLTNNHYHFVKVPLEAIDL